MISDEARLIEARRLRDAARGVVRTDVATLRFALAQRPLGKRIWERVVTQATEVAKDGVALANENRLVVALTVSTLCLWLFRKPLLRLARPELLLAPIVRVWRSIT